MKKNFVYDHYESSMPIYVYTPSGKKIKIGVEPSYAIRDVKDIIERAERIPRYFYNLIFGGRLLEDDRRTLSYYNIQEESILVV